MKPSKNIALHIESPDKAKEFYKNVFGLPPIENPSEVQFGDTTLYIDPPYVDDSGNNITGPIFELLVDDVEATRENLVAQGCKILLWQGKGKCCYIEDPFGIRFNLYEEVI